MNFIIRMVVDEVEMRNSALYPTNFAHSQLKFLKRPCVS